MLDYATLKFIWWLLICVLVSGFAITGGMDIGANILLGLVGRSENDRRFILNAIGPTWEGNQVWLVTFGGALFAAWPIVYATAFSSMYFALMLVLLMLILRPPGFDYRSKIDSDDWRKTWDILLFGGSILLAVLFGVAVGNLFLGLPFYFTEELRSIYTGSLLTLLHPGALLFGVVSFCMMTMQGGIYLQYKLSGRLAMRAKSAAKYAGVVFIISFIAAGYYVAYELPGYFISSIPNPSTSFAVTQKIVESAKTGWLSNYYLSHTLWAFPVGSILLTVFAIHRSQMLDPVKAILANSVAIACTVLTAASALFPFILVSTLNPNHSLTVWDATSSHKTLLYMLIATVIFLPIVLLYTTWVYKVMRGKVKLQHESY